MRKSNRSFVESAITSKGQATIPKAVREHLGLRPGDRVKFFVHPDGSVVLLPKRPAATLRGILASQRKRVEAAAMDDAVAAGALEGTRPRKRR
jgi:AbrB family looped-hinge helix DNA binding protein